MTKRNEGSADAIARKIEGKALELGIIDKPLDPESRLRLTTKISRFEYYNLMTRTGGLVLKRRKPTERKLKDKLMTALQEEMQFLSPELQEMLIDDLITSFQSRFITLMKIQQRPREAVSPISPTSPLEPRLARALIKVATRIELQIQRLDEATERFAERDKKIFGRIVDAFTKDDMPRASVFANELAQIRKMEKMMINARLALEQIVLRLGTVSELGDVVTTLAPAVSVLRSVRTRMSAVFPEAERELEQIETILTATMIDACESTGSTIDFEKAEEDAQKTLNKSAELAKQLIKEKFPQLPAGISTNEKS